MEISIEVKRVDSRGYACQFCEYRIERQGSGIKLVDVTDGMSAETDAKPEQVDELARLARIAIEREIAEEWEDPDCVKAICEAWEYDEDGETVNLRELWRIG